MQRTQHGFALVTALAILVILTVIGLVMVSNATFEIRQSSSSAGLAAARAAAEAGQTEQQYYLWNSGLSDISSVFQPYVDEFARSSRDARTSPIVTHETAALASLNAMPGTIATGALDTGVAYSARTHFSNLRADPGSFSSQQQVYYVDYRVTADGSVGRYRRTVITTGTMSISLGRRYLNQYVLLADDGGSGPNGRSGFFDGTLTFNGPVHVNRNWALTGRPTFLSGATTAASQVFMDANCSYTFTLTNTQGLGCTQPNTNGFGLQYSVPAVDLPRNSFSQERAALGLNASVTSQPSRSEICAALRDAAPNNCGTSLPGGVYVPNANGALTGGIYINGNAASVMLSVNAQGQQVYTITAGGQTTTITVDATTQRTTIATPTGTRTFSGVPNGQLYATGTIDALSGPARHGALPVNPPSHPVPVQVQPAVASITQLNVAAAGNVVITGDLVYQSDPRTVSSARNVLGIISGTGNVMIGTAAPNDVYVHGAILAGANGRGLGVVNSGDRARGPRGAIHLLGSVAEQQDLLRGSVNAQGRVVAGYSDAWNFDQRFFNGAVAPPFFPATSLFTVRSSLPVQHTWKEE